MQQKDSCKSSSASECRFFNELAVYLNQYQYKVGTKTDNASNTKCCKIFYFHLYEYHKSNIRLLQIAIKQIQLRDNEFFITQRRIVEEFNFNFKKYPSGRAFEYLNLAIMI